MENNFKNRDFEQFVKQNADQYRMFPSEKVWNGVHHTLHGRNKWWGIGLALLLLTTVSVTWIMLVPSNKNQQIADKLPALASIPSIADNSKISKKEPVIITPVRPVQHNNNLIAAGDPDNLFSADLAQPSIIVDDNADANGDANPVMATVTVSPVTANGINSRDLVIKSVPVSTKIYPEEKAYTPVAAKTSTYNNVVVVDETMNNEPVVAKQEAGLMALKDINLLTIESVVNSYKHNAKKDKFNLRAYFTPTVSYRRLRENNPFIAASRSAGSPSTTTLAIAEVNNVVTHKPDIGLQLGVNAGYPLSRRFTLIAGLQFNVSKYTIRAYDYPSETATIALMSAAPTYAETTHRNYNSGTQDPSWLHNLYFSASIPVGLELRLSGFNKTEIGVAGTIQPTYMLGNRTYLLSTDYKNYAEVPALVRKWNMSTSLEAYAGYSTGKISWRIGPQVRYQLMSSYRQTYPMKEHLFDYGLKVGIILNK